MKLLFLTLLIAAIATASGQILSTDKLTIKCSVIGYEADTALVKKILADYNFAKDMGLSNLKKAEVTITQTIHQYCLFNSSKTDGLEMRFTIVKDSITKGYIAKRLDFYPEYTIETLNGTVIFTKPVFSFNEEDRNAPEGYVYYQPDMYTRVLEPYRWNVLSVQGCGSGNLFSSGERSVSKQEYKVYSRNGPLDTNWKLANIWEVEKDKDCDGDITYYTNTPYGLGKRGSNSMLSNLPTRPFFNTSGEFIHDILKASHEQTPYPSDSIKGVYHGKNYGEKKRMLIDLLSNSNELQFSNSDSLRGAWLDEHDNAIYIIPGTNKELLYKISLSYESLFNEKGYLTDMKTMNTAEINNKEITINWTGRNTYGQITSQWREYYIFKKITTDKITLGDREWKRIAHL